MMTLFFFVHCYSLAQKASPKLLTRIYLEEYDYTFRLDGKCIATLSDEISNDRKLKINIFNCKGQLDLECYIKDTILIEKGSYINSLTLLKKYTYFHRFVPKPFPGHNEYTIGVYSYYQPLRNGVWYFYQSKKLYMKKEYNKGILIDSIMVK